MVDIELSTIFLFFYTLYTIPFYDNMNQTLPVGMDVSSIISVENNGVKYFTDINVNSPISHFLVDDGEFGHGMVLAAIYKQLIDFQNTFLNQIINSKSEILSCFKEQLNQEIMMKKVLKK